ncbi:hypothetical protein ACTMTJ_21660 [Phytohabitans sp. LJ34]|uniref:hypothetical protein n=1 Tax=Phytohabitans sp. LJ34 TaxID=3452217 RepID=UPI003F88B3D5
MVELTALASTAATTVVAAMATTAWEAARAGVARLLGRGSPPKTEAVEAQLDDEADLVSGAGAGEVAQVRAELVPVWRRKIERLLADDANAAVELNALVDEIQRALPAEQRQWADTVVQNNIAVGPGSMAAGIIGSGSIIHHGAHAGDPPARPPA